MLLKRLPATINMIDRGPFSSNERSCFCTHSFRRSTLMSTEFTFNHSILRSTHAWSIQMHNTCAHRRYGISLSRIGCNPARTQALILTRHCSCVLTRRNTRSTQRVQSEFLEYSVVLHFSLSGWIRLPFTWLSGSEASLKLHQRHPIDS
jgi:hypothetical protein